MTSPSLVWTQTAEDGAEQRGREALSHRRHTPLKSPLPTTRGPPCNSHPDRGSPLLSVSFCTVLSRFSSTSSVRERTGSLDGLSALKKTLSTPSWSVWTRTTTVSMFYYSLTLVPCAGMDGRHGCVCVRVRACVCVCVWVRRGHGCTEMHGGIRRTRMLCFSSSFSPANLPRKTTTVLILVLRADIHTKACITHAVGLGWFDGEREYMSW